LRCASIFIPNNYATAYIGKEEHAAIIFKIFAILFKFISVCTSCINNPKLFSFIIHVEIHHLTILSFFLAWHILASCHFVTLQKVIKNLWCSNFLIFQTILINDVSNKIVLNGLQFELIKYLFLSSVFDK
jgi:hypothetical protein